MRTYRSKLACINCGLETFYRFPYKADIQHYKGYDDDKEREFSSYESGDTQYDLNCMNCGLGYLTGSNFWEQESKDGIRTGDTRSEDSSST